MTSLERRHEARYLRRKAAREKIRQEKYGKFDNFDEIISFSALAKANKQTKKNVCWKTSVQRYQMNLLRNLSETHDKLKKGQSISKGFVEFDTIERGKKRHIRSVHYSERVVHQSACNNALVPMLSRGLIYDNGACLKGKGVDQALDRMEAHLYQFYKDNGNSNDGWILVFDFSDYFGQILHKVCFNMYDKQFADKRIVELLKSFIVPFGYPPASNSWKRVKTPDDTSLYSGKSLGLGSPLSQITAVAYPNSLDHSIKQDLRTKQYGRYMDDGRCLYKMKEEAKFVLSRIREMANLLGIRLNEKKTQILKLSKGFTFLKVKFRLTEKGKVIRKLCRSSITRTRRKLKKLAAFVKEGFMTPHDAKNSYGSWKGYALHRGGEAVVRKLDALFVEIIGIPAPKCKLKNKLYNRRKQLCMKAA